MHTIKPNKSFIFAKPDEAEETTKAGIILVGQAKERPKTATVINVGDDVKDHSRGDVIVYKEYTTAEIKVNGDDYIMLDEQDVLGKLIEVED